MSSWGWIKKPGACVSEARTLVSNFPNSKTMRSPNWPYSPPSAQILRLHLARQRAEASPMDAAPQSGQSRAAWPRFLRRRLRRSRRWPGERFQPAPPIATPAALPVMPRGWPLTSSPTPPLGPLLPPPPPNLQGSGSAGRATQAQLLP